MKKTLLILFALLVAPMLCNAGAAAQAEEYPQGYQVADQWSYELLSPETLDDLLAPIALYPDPLIAQILPAATFIDQIHAAASYVRRFGPARVDYQPWDISVKAIAHYPKVLYMMARDHQWTVALGQAFVEQPQEVMDAVQRLRDYAWAQGNLYSTHEQEVVYETGVIRIVPARPQYLYIPAYDPYAVYVEPYSPSYPLITFSVGFSIGAWLNRDCDWRQRRVYYHGWRGSRWVDRARPHVRDRRGIYITPRASTINVNTRVTQRDTRVYRQQLRTEGVRRRQEGRFPSAPVRTERPRPGRIEQPRPGTLQQQRRERVEPVRPGGQRLEQQRTAPRQQAPAATGEQAPATIRPQAPAPRQQAPAATGRQRGQSREGQGVERRRELRQINRPPASVTSPAAVPAPVSPHPPARVIQTPPAAPPTVVPAPRTPTVHPPAPSVTPAPAPSAIPVPRSAEPAAPSRPAREQQPGIGRGRPDVPSAPRAAPREGR